MIVERLIYFFTPQFYLQTPPTPPFILLSFLFIIHPHRLALISITDDLFIPFIVYLPSNPTSFLYILTFMNRQRIKITSTSCNNSIVHWNINRLLIYTRRSILFPPTCVQYYKSLDVMDMWWVEADGHICKTPWWWQERQLCVCLDFC